MWYNLKKTRERLEEKKVKSRKEMECREKSLNKGREK